MNGSTEGDFSHDAAILLGASTYTNHQVLDVGDGPKNSSEAFRNYLTNRLGLPATNVLDLFDSVENHAGQMEAVRNHLREVMKRAGKRVPRIIVYYVGHGLHELESKDFALSIRNTEAQFPVESSLKASDLAKTLQRLAGHTCRLVVLDCCYAAEAGRHFMAEPTAVYKEADQAFQHDGRRLLTRWRSLPEIPTRGCALLCATDRDTKARAVKGERYTRFFQAFFNALTYGDENAPPWLTLGELRDLAWRELFVASDARPYLCDPEQSEGDISELLRLFPNPAVSGGVRRGYVLRELPPDDQMQKIPSVVVEREAKRLMRQNGHDSKWWPVSGWHVALYLIGVVGIVAILFDGVSRGYSVRAAAPPAASSTYQVVPPAAPPAYPAARKLYLSGPPQAVGSVGSNHPETFCYPPDDGWKFLPETAKVHRKVDSQNNNAPPNNDAKIASATEEEICMYLESKPTQSNYRARIEGYIEAEEVRR